MIDGTTLPADIQGQSRERQRRIISCCAVGLAPALIVWLAWPREPITQSIYNEIAMGMTLSQVEEVVGMPGLDVLEAARIATAKGRLQWIRIDNVIHEGNDFANSNDLTRVKAWQGHLSVLTVKLGEDGRVIGKHFEERHRWSVVAEIRTWLGSRPAFAPKK